MHQQKTNGFEQQSSMVVLHVYTNSNPLEKKLPTKLQGAGKAIDKMTPYMYGYHFGVEAFGREFSWRPVPSDDDGSGVFDVSPTTAPQAFFSQSFSMGPAQMTEDNFDAFVQNCRADWPAETSENPLLRNMEFAMMLMHNLGADGVFPPDLASHQKYAAGLAKVWGTTKTVSHTAFTKAKTATILAASQADEWRLSRGYTAERLQESLPPQVNHAVNTIGGMCGCNRGGHNDAQTEITIDAPVQRGSAEESLYSSTYEPYAPPQQGFRGERVF